MNICYHMLTSSKQLQNRSFYVVERTRTSAKCQKIKKCTCKACKNTVFHCQICKFVGFMLLSSSWLLKIPIVTARWATIHEARIRRHGSGILFRWLELPNVAMQREMFDVVICLPHFRFTSAGFVILCVFFHNQIGSCLI